MKKVKQNRSIKKFIYLGLGLAALVGVIFFVKNKLMVSPQIAQISDQYCQSNVAKFSVSDECTYGTYKSYSFTCKNGVTVERPSSGACYEYFSAYQDAQKTCGVTCSTPSPSMSSTTRPSQSPIASPSAPTRPFPSPSAPSSTAYPSPSLASSPIATPSAPPACRAQEVTHYAFRELCPVPAGATEQYRFIDYTCGDETTPRSMGSSESCQFYTSLKSGAEYYCRKNSCSTSTPTPTPTPTPQPPVVSCTTEVYRLPARFNATAVSSEILAKYKVNTRNLVARPGDRFAFNLNMTSKTKKSVADARFDFTSWTTTTLGEAAPFTIVQAGESCQIYPDKSVRCGVSRLNSPDRRQSLRPNTYMVVSFDEVNRPTKTDLTYNTIFAGENVACSTVNINVLPKPVRRCYGIGKMQWCRNVDVK